MGGSSFFSTFNFLNYLKLESITVIFVSSLNILMFLFLFHSITFFVSLFQDGASGNKKSSRCREL